MFGFKTVENYTLQECNEFLKTHDPSDPQWAEVETRRNHLAAQENHRKEAERKKAEEIRLNTPLKLGWWKILILFALGFGIGCLVERYLPYYFAWCSAQFNMFGVSDADSTDWALFGIPPIFGVITILCFILYITTKRAPEKKRTRLGLTYTFLGATLSVFAMGPYLVYHEVDYDYQFRGTPFGLLYGNNSYGIADNFGNTMIRPIYECMYFDENGNIVGLFSPTYTTWSTDTYRLVGNPPKAIIKEPISHAHKPDLSKIRSQYEQGLITPVGDSWNLERTLINLEAGDPSQVPAEVATDEAVADYAYASVEAEEAPAVEEAAK